jgi:hypothetical protein
MSYEYVCPTEKGYQQVTISKKQHNELFPKRKLSWNSTAEYYIKDKQLIIHRFMSIPAKVAFVVLSPFLIIIFAIVEGVKRLPEIKDEFKDLNEKKYGKFSSDWVSSSHDSYEKFKSIMKECHESCRKM